MYDMKLAKALGCINQLEEENRNLKKRAEKAEAERDELRNWQENYMDRLWCALGQLMGIEYIEAVAKMRRELEDLKSKRNSSRLHKCGYHRRG